MTADHFNIHLQTMQRSTVDTLVAKAAEYATADRLHNFKVAAALEGTTPENALGGMMCKHTVSVYDMIRDTTAGKTFPIALWEEKIKDHINYLFLLWAIINEERTVDYGTESQQSENSGGQPDYADIATRG